MLLRKHRCDAKDAEKIVDDRDRRRKSGNTEDLDRINRRIQRSDPTEIQRSQWFAAVKLAEHFFEGLFFKGLRLRFEVMIHVPGAVEMSCG